VFVCISHDGNQLTKRQKTSDLASAASTIQQQQQSTAVSVTELGLQFGLSALICNFLVLLCVVLYFGLRW